MTHDSDEVLCDKLKNSSVQSTDHRNNCNVVFVRFTNEGEVQEEFMCCKELPETS